MCTSLDTISLKKIKTLAILSKGVGINSTFIVMVVSLSQEIQSLGESIVDVNWYLVFGMM